MQKVEFVPPAPCRTSRNLVRVFFLRDSSRALRRPMGRPSGMSSALAPWARYRRLVRVAWLHSQSCRHDQNRLPARSSAPRALWEDWPDNRRKVHDARPADLISGARACLSRPCNRAVPEKLDLKQKIYRNIEPKMRPGAILTTNGVEYHARTVAGACSGRAFVSIHSSIQCRACSC
jgi:3-hydroxyacyl-CoA dehydrogenase/enoyl-CoA hydratase/3-hydroxybutyryl-CoA epimerase